MMRAMPRPIRARLAPLLVAALLAPPAAAAELDEPVRQVLIEAAIVALDDVRLMQLGVEPFDRKDRIDPATEAAQLGLLGQAQADTQIVITMIAAQPGFNATPDAAAALTFAAGALGEMEDVNALLTGPKPVKIGKLEDATQQVVDHLVATIPALQGRPDRFLPGKHLDDEVGPYFDKLDFNLVRLEDNGIPYELGAFFETFTAKGKIVPALARIGVVPDLGVKVELKDGVLALRPDSKTLATGGVRLVQTLPDEFTVFVTYTLPDKLGKKAIDALTGYSMGLAVSSDATATPAQTFVVEHQTSELGFVQTFTAGATSLGSTTFDTFVHATPSLERRLRTFVVKDADSVQLGVLYREGDVETLHQSSVPYVGSLPVLNLYFRNGTKKIKAEADNLLVLITPHTIVTPGP
jgi:hypothetical protein